jgi:NAD(P)-dependent dehydrogenase (short-subunit alcohol dehydrogenase family)
VHHRHGHGPLTHRRSASLQLDVTEEDHWRSLAAKALDVGEVDIVVNNAGYFPNRSIDELDLATWRKTFATNLDAHFLSAKYFVPAMRKKKWGRWDKWYLASLYANPTVKVVVCL